MTGSNSDKVRNEGRENLFGYVTMNTCQPIVNRHAAELFWGSLAETYAEGRCEMYVHFRTDFVQGGEVGNWCAIFDRTGDYLDFIGYKAFNSEEHGGGPEKGNMRQPVFVLNSKLVELPERIVGKPIPSVVWLQPLDNCLRVWVDAPDFVTTFPQLHFSVSKDGELQQTRSAFGQGVDACIGESELKDEVVESVAEVLETIADDEAEFSGRGWLEDFDPKDLFGAISIAFGPGSVWIFFAPDLHFGLKAIQVVNRPAQPSFVVVSHAREE